MEGMGDMEVMESSIVLISPQCMGESKLRPRKTACNLKYVMQAQIMAGICTHFRS